MMTTTPPNASTPDPLSASAARGRVVPTKRKAWDDTAGADGGWMTERQAVAIALDGSPVERLRVGAGALRRLLADPDDTVQVFLMGLVLNAPFFPQLLTRIATDAAGARLLEEKPLIDGRSVDWDRLRALPGSTLGGAYTRYLDDNHLDPDLFHAPPGLPEPARFIAQRIRQTHDVWHVLTGYAPDVPGELALQGFTFAQLHMPSALLLSTLGTAARAPRAARTVLDGYRRGRDAKFLPVVRFEDAWERDLDEVRRELRVRPAAA